VKVGDKVLCKNDSFNRGAAVIIEMDNKSETAAIIFLKIGMYNPEIVYQKDLEVISEN